MSWRGLEMLGRLTAAWESFTISSSVPCLIFSHFLVLTENIWAMNSRKVTLTITREKREEVDQTIILSDNLHLLGFLT